MTRALPIPLWRALAILRRIWFRIYDRLGQGARSAALTQMDHLEDALKTKRKIRVGFVVCTPAKWSAAALFDALTDDPAFEAGFHPTLSDAALRLPADQRRAEAAKTSAFFADIGPLWNSLYDPATDRMHSPNILNADIIFIQQPWGMQDLPRQLAGQALPAYIHYGYAVIQNDRMQFGLPDFHPYLWRHIVPDALHQTAMANSATPQAREVLAVGHPKLDAYLTPPPDRASVPHWANPTETARKRILFAPHHTLDTNSLAMATFPWSGPAILALAQQHPEMDFLQKPHPNLPLEMARAGGQVEAEYHQFLSGWQAAPNCTSYDGGSYFDLFRTSDAMITDSGSFLAEYLPTGCPLIRLTRDGSAPLNSTGQTLSAGFYSAPDAVTLHDLFGQLMIANKDPLKNTRQAAAANLLPGQPSAQTVLDHLRGYHRAK